MRHNRKARIKWLEDKIAIYRAELSLLSSAESRRNAAARRRSALEQIKQEVIISDGMLQLLKEDKQAARTAARLVKAGLDPTDFPEVDPSELGKNCEDRGLDM